MVNRSMDTSNDGRLLAITDHRKMPVHIDRIAEILDAVHLLAPVLTEEEEAVSFSLSPYFLVNLDPLTIGLEVPMAGFVQPGDTVFMLANANLDLRFGHHFGDAIPFGLSYGVQAWFPTGGARADTLALANLLAAPRFLHQH
ncbi:MAG: hypothetical protein HZB57_02200, partial [Gammaproteobacteria bacterium]|nr:hypothetical protein [Gammaproteobacteria bacterium]